MKSNILGFAVKNFRDRFLIPSSDNYFNGIQIDYVLIDSGSNSSLFPLPMATNGNFDIHYLIQHFPYDQYQWTIGLAPGVGLISDTTLQIKPIEDEGSCSIKISCSLHTDIKPLNFNLPHIRFSLNKESIQILFNENSIPFADPDREALEKALKLLNQLEEQFPSLINQKRRNYCLLGQHFLRNVCSVQLNDTMIFLDKNIVRQKAFPPFNTNINEIANHLYYQRPEFSKSEKFLMCEDDEHGGRDFLNISQQIDADEFN